MPLVMKCRWKRRGAAGASSPAGSSRLAYLGPVAVIAIYGAVWIDVHASAGRGQTHMRFQILALAENVAAPLVRRRKPSALASILAVYQLVDLEPTTALPVLLALLTVTMLSDYRRLALAFITIHPGNSLVYWAVGRR